MALNMHEPTLKWLTNVDEDLLGEMIRDLEPAVRSVIAARERPEASIGTLVKAPNEVMMMILELLDIQSVVRFSQVCSTIKELVDFLKPYRRVMEVCPQTLTALSKTGLLKHYTSGQVEDVLRSEKCVSCYAFGGFLFLPTLERACFTCLDRNSSLRVMRIADAKSVFALTDDHLQEIPVMKSLPGEYSITQKVIKKRAFRLVSVKHAKKLALRVHGSMERIFALTKRFDELTARRRHSTLVAILHAPLEAPAIDMSRQPKQPYLLEDHFAGMASMRFPSLTKNGLDYGRLCGGCECSFLHYERGLLPSVVEKHLSEPMTPARGPIRSAMSQLHSLEDFKEHVRTCYGAIILVAQEKSLHPQTNLTLTPLPSEDHSEDHSE